MEKAPRSLWGWKAKMIAAFVLGGLFVGALHVRLRWQIAACYEEMRSQGLPTNEEELDAFYKVPEGVTDSTAEWVPAMSQTYAAMLVVNDPDGLRLLGYQDFPPYGSPWEQLGAFQVALQKLAPQLEMIHHAASVGGQVRFPDHTRGNPTEIALLLRMELAVAGHTGNASQCLKSLKAIFALANCEQGQPDLLSLMAILAIRELAHVELESWLPHCPWTDGELSSLQEVICAVDLRSEFRIALAGDCIKDLEGVEEMGRFPCRARNELEHLQRYADARKDLTRPWHEIINRYRDLDLHVDSLGKSRFDRWALEAFLMNALPLQSLAQSISLGVVRQATANAGLAAQRYRLRHGRLPNSLEEIDRDYFGKLPDGSIPLLDPFNGQPLRFGFNENELVIYSVGMDQIDSGGDRKASAKGKGYKDIGFALRR